MTRAGRMAPTRTRLLWDLRPGDETADGCPTVVHLPHAGGSASAFTDWAAALPDGVRALAAQYPGRGPRLDEPHAAHVDELSGPLADELADTAGPLVVVGHSLGALVGLDVVRRLERCGREVTLMVASSARAPWSPTLFEGRDVPDHDELAELLRRSGGLPSIVVDHEELLALALDAVRADLELLERSAADIRPRPPVRAPVRVVAGREDALVPLEMLSGWDRTTSGTRATALFPGGHFRDPAELCEIASMVGDALASSATSTGGTS